MTVRDKVILVTGGASGIGGAAAELFARNGAAVVIADKNGEQAATKAAVLVKEGLSASAIALDVGQSDEVRNAITDIAGTHGRIDVLMHCAGVCPFKPFLDMLDEDWRAVMQTNLDGTFYITQAVARVMIPQRVGTMILVTSDRGIHGSIDYAHYAASKGGMIALTKSLAMILGKHGITVNGLNPGMTDTPLARNAIQNWEGKQASDVLGSYSKPEEIAEIALFLAGTAGQFMTGQIVANRMRLGM